jgi:hypothetical protein
VEASFLFDHYTGKIRALRANVLRIGTKLASSLDFALFFWYGNTQNVVLKLNPIQN